MEGLNADVCSDYKNCGKLAPCLNGGQCVPNYEKNGKCFIYHCPLKFTGALCRTKRAKYCAEVWGQGWRQSGHYVIFEPGFKWTLVESFSLENVVRFRKADAIAVNEGNPDWSQYKMSHAQMQHVRATGEPRATTPPVTSTKQTKELKEPTGHKQYTWLLTRRQISFIQLYNDLCIINCLRQSKNILRTKIFKS